jgi:DNA-binding NarL/FixJ family response regulator
MLRAALRRWLGRQGRFAVVGSHGDVHAAIEEMRESHPDVLLLDLVLPGMNEIEAMNLVHREFPDLPIIIVTHHADERSIARALRQGARAYVSKDAEEIELLLALDSARLGVLFVSPRLVRAQARSRTNSRLRGYADVPKAAADRRV